MAKRFVQKYNGTELVLVDSDDHEIESYGAIRAVEDDAQLSQWAESDSFVCRYDNEVYVKVRNPIDEDQYEMMTQTEANEWFADRD